MNKADMNEVIFLLFLSIGSLFDLKTKLIPIVLLVSSAIAGVILRLAYRDLSIWEVIAGMSLGLGILVISKLTEGAIGQGDGLLLLVSGIYLGFWNNLAMLLYGLFMSAVFSCGALLLHKGNRKMTFPFLPFLLAAEIWRLLL